MTPPSPNSWACDFLAGRRPNSSGRTVEEVLAFSDEDLELEHDYIQWLFPLTVESAFNPDAPVLTAEDICLIRADEAAQANLGRALERMLLFYERTNHWLVRSNHNHLRITRIIESARLLMNDHAARGFYDKIMRRVEQAGRPVAPENMRYWWNAVDRSDGG